MKKNKVTSKRRIGKGAFHKVWNNSTQTQATIDLLESTIVRLQILSRLSSSTLIFIAAHFVFKGYALSPFFSLWLCLLSTSPTTPLLIGNTLCYSVYKSPIDNVHKSHYETIPFLV